jgi:polysaccharide deacetylase family protein (PEP-CTERM system associated)
MAAPARDDPLAAQPLPPRRAALLTVDVEDWFHVNYRSWSPPSDFVPVPRVREATARVLDACARRGRRGTFFVLGEAARTSPGLVRDIAAGGHEVACHGLTHALCYESRPERLTHELRDARRLLEDQLGNAVLGFRAPSWSITRPALWVLDAVVAAGFRYDASLFPVPNYLYGLREAPLLPARVRTPGGAELLEIPAPAVALGPLRVPHGGGFYLRLLPLWVERLAQRARLRRGIPALVYLHPSELDEVHHGLPLAAGERLIQEFGRARARRKLLRLLTALPWVPIAEAYAAELDAARAAGS